MIKVSAPSNIALIKYWGKRDRALNLPLTSSLSITLSSLISEATVEESTGSEDLWDIMGDPSKSQRVLAAARKDLGDHRPLKISIVNHFPSGAGLASSASSMAALALALSQFLGSGEVPLQQIATWSRLGSGSSVRSLLPGYVLWEAGTDPEGKDCLVRQLHPASHLPLSLVVCVVNDQPKHIGSTAAMERCRDTSPIYDGFHQRNDADLQLAQEALVQGDLLTLGRVAEANCLAMHNVMHQAIPPVDYFMPGTHEAIALTRQLRANGVPCFFTIDAGPNVKIFCSPEYQEVVSQACRALPGLVGILEDRLGLSYEELLTK